MVAITFSGLMLLLSLAIIVGNVHSFQSTPLMTKRHQAVAPRRTPTSELHYLLVAAEPSVADILLSPTTEHFLDHSSAMLLLSAAADDTAVTATASLRNSDIWVFVAGIIPFLWATIEFWRRIAVGEPFGTGSDSVVIGEDNNPGSSRGRRVLGKDALIVAYFLFGISAAVVALVLYTVITNDPLPVNLPSVVNEQQLN